jgi:hypothetical protein
MRRGCTVQCEQTVREGAAGARYRVSKQCGKERRSLGRGDILRQILRALYPKLINPELVSEAGPHCLLIVYRCTRAVPQARQPRAGVRGGASLFAHTVPVLPYTLAASSSLA